MDLVLESLEEVEFFSFGASSPGVCDDVASLGEDASELELDEKLDDELDEELEDGILDEFEEEESFDDSFSETKDCEEAVDESDLSSWDCSSISRPSLIECSSLSPMRVPLVGKSSVLGYTD